jgi:hypothetical protein
MKILRKKRAVEWWVGLEVWCGSCFAVMELESGDNVEVRDSALGHFIRVCCPECDADAYKAVSVSEMERQSQLNQPHA